MNFGSRQLGITNCFVFEDISGGCINVYLLCSASLPQPSTPGHQGRHKKGWNNLTAVLITPLGFFNCLLLSIAVGYKSLLLYIKKTNNKTQRTFKEYLKTREATKKLFRKPKAQSKIILCTLKFIKTSTSIQKALLYFSQIYFEADNSPERDLYFLPTSQLKSCKMPGYSFYTIY